MRRLLSPAIACLGLAAAVAGAVFAPHQASAAAQESWPPFVLVAGLLLIGVVANEDGLFDALAGPLTRLPGGTGLYVGSMALVAVVTVFLNLDTSVAFLTPVLILAARRRSAPEMRFLYGCVFMSNAASLLLPGSNLTNLLVLGSEPVSGGSFALRMLPAWGAAVVITALLPPLFLRQRSTGPALTVAPIRPHRPLLSTVAVVAAVILVLLSHTSAGLVFGLGSALALVEIARSRLRPSVVVASVGPITLAGLFGLSVGLGALGRSWPGPSNLLAHGGRAGTAVIGAVAAVTLNNLPAAVLLGSSHPAHARALLIGLNLGPNLAVSGSLSAVLWWRAARLVGAHPSAVTYSRIGIILVPLSLAGALLALQILAPGHL